MKRILLVLLSTLTLSFALAGCEDGVAEQTGENIDNAVQDVGNQIEDTCENVKEGVNADDTDC